MAEFKRLLLPVLPRAAPKTLEEFLEGYSGDRRYKRYKEAVESLEHTDVAVKDSYVAAFVKSEKGHDKCPRIIQPRTPRYNAAVGRWLRHLEKPIYKAIKRATRAHRVKAVVAKGLNAEATATALWDGWESMVDPVAVFTDASRFDQHFREPALRFEHSVYKACYPGSGDELAKLLGWQLHCTGFVHCDDGTIRYKSRGGRMSGDMNTSLGNCLVMTAMMWSWANQATTGQVRIYNNGDDVVTLMERSDSLRFSQGAEEYFRRLGFTIVIEGTTDVFERIAFCQTQPVLLGDTYVMVRDPRVAISKDCHIARAMSSAVELRRHMRSIADCGLSLTGGCPVWESFYVALRRIAGPIRPVSERDTLGETGMRMMARGMARLESPIGPATRVSFWLAFGIHPYDQCVLEKAHREWSFTPSKPQVVDCVPPAIEFYVPHDHDQD
jgi:hypothetical protein